MTKFRFTVDGKSLVGTNADIEGLYNSCKKSFEKAKTIDELEKVLMRVINLKNNCSRLVADEFGSFEVAEAFKIAHIKAFKSLQTMIENRIKEEKTKAAIISNGEETVRDLITAAAEMLKLKQKSSAVAMLRTVKAICNESGIKIPDEYVDLQLKTTEI